MGAMNATNSNAMPRKQQKIKKGNSILP